MSVDNELSLSIMFWLRKSAEQITGRMEFNDIRNLGVSANDAQSLAQVTIAMLALRSLGIKFDAQPSKPQGSIPEGASSGLTP